MSDPARLKITDAEWRAAYRAVKYIARRNLTENERAGYLASLFAELRTEREGTCSAPMSSM